jgi:hypothetical protein
LKIVLLNRSIATVIVTAIMIGQVVSMTPDYQKAKQAANRVFHLIGHVPHIDSYSDAGEQPVREGCYIRPAVISLFSFVC